MTWDQYSDALMHLLKVRGLSMLPMRGRSDHLI